MKRTAIYNRIWLPVALLLIFLLGAMSVPALSVQALALEQEARCGITEHVHTQECMQNGRLICPEPAHSHTENCYLILLKENDINFLLTEVEKQEDNRLETAIGQTVDNALQYNRNLTSPMEQSPEASMDVAAINETITTYDIQPQMVLNENLYKSTASYDGDLPEQEQPLVQMAAPDANLSGMTYNSTESTTPQPNSNATFALGDKENKNNNMANYYVHLDGRWQMVGSLEFTSQRSGWYYYARETARDIQNLYNNALGITSLSTSDLDLDYSEDEDFGTTANATAESSYIYFGKSYSSRNNARVPKYVRLMDGSDPLSFYTVTFQYTDGRQTEQIVREGEAAVLPTGAFWKLGDKGYTGSLSDPITGTTTFVQWPSYTVTYRFMEQEEQTVIVYEGQTVTLPEGTAWVYNGTAYDGGTEITVTQNMVFEEDNSAYAKVIFQYLDGTETSQWVKRGQQVILPAGTDWLLDGQTYTGGSAVTVEQDLIFAEKPVIKIHYDVNFPTVSGVTYHDPPTILGSSVTELTDLVAMGSDARIRNVSGQEIIGKVNNHSVGLSRVAGFMGWRIRGTEEVISANATLTWAELQNYTGSGYELQLEGVWQTREQQTASFYIRYDSVAVDTEGNMTSQDSNKYTPELYASFVGGVDAAEESVNTLNSRYYIADTTADNSYGADQEIRALYGRTDGIWLQSFPRDEDVFEQLKDYAEYLQVDGEPVRAEDLNPNAYAIRWYVFKCQTDAWHIDGRLVKKEGWLDIAKSFAGNQDAVAQAKENFYIHATNRNGDKQYYLCLSEPGWTPQNGTVLLPSKEEGNTYVWSVSGVGYAEPWTITDIPGVPADGRIICHSDYRVVDGYNTQNKSGSGTSVDVSGMTYAMDMGEVQALRVEYTNIYHETDSVIIKKEDYATGQPLGGAVFCLQQNGEDLHFRYDAEKDRYLFDPEGDITELTGNGYYELVVEGFSYENGPVDVMEVRPPDGYTPVESLQVGLADDGSVRLLTPSDMARFDNGLLVIRNSTDSTSVSVEKHWMCPEEEWQPVTVQLLANDLPVTALIPGVEPSQQLNEENGYEAIWTDLPLYANGQEIRWSVRETRIGNEDCLSDFTFANWLVDYSYPDYEYDDDWHLVNTHFTVTNDTRRTMLRLIKTNMGGGVRLEGATFTLERLNGTEPDLDFVVRTMTTGPDGTLTFDNLKFGDYRLTELRPPLGYLPVEEPAYLTIHTDGTVEVQGHPYVLPGSTAFSVQVLNQPERPLPLTGGVGTGGYIALGLLLMTAATFGMALPRSRRKGGVTRSG